MNAAADRMRSSASVLRDEPLARHTSWRVGGPADTFFEPATIEQLKSFLGSLPAGEPVHFIGRGSNLLVRDGGIRGTVVCTRELARDFRQLDDGRVAAGAGLPCATLARRSVRLKLGPAAFFAGIPGTLGGALAMNAGAFGGETWDSVETVTTIDRSGAVRDRPREEYTVGYRTVSGPAGEWFTAAVFRFRADADESAEAVKALMSRRGASQPLTLPSAGSVFRNPPGRHAAELIERAGLKGRRIGDAMVSDKHANFIVNTGNATAAAIERLIDEVRLEVERRFGVVLEPEVRIVGEAAEGER
jgi:UDP-N-acetylmuramate dehydrogenase